jgi:acetyl-CoA carboxylase biotin carboxyl carrier protein
MSDRPQTGHIKSTDVDFAKAEIVCKRAFCRYTMWLNRHLLLRKDTGMAQENADLLKIKELIEMMKENDLAEVEIKHGDDKIFLKRSQPQPPAITAVPVITPHVSSALSGANATQASVTEAASSGPQQKTNLVEIKSPLVGTFYATPSPDSEPYVELGSPVTSQTVVCVIEAMKVMNEIKAETTGTIAEILVTNGQAVEFGQVLFRVKPD